MSVKKTEPQKKEWVMPDWMELFREYFVNTGGNTIEELVNTKVDSRTNAVLAFLQDCVTSQIQLLQRAFKKGLLATKVYDVAIELRSLEDVSNETKGNKTR